MRAQRRRRSCRASLALALAAVLAGCGGTGATSTATSAQTSGSATTSRSSTSSTPDSAQPGFEGVPIEAGAPIASAATTGTSTVDGIACGPTEQLAYHIHAHLAVFDDGASRALPGGIGIPGSHIVVDPQVGPVAAGGLCIYWLHTHAPDGVIHIESPTPRIYTLGEFFDEWRQPLGADRVGDITGPVMASVDGHPWRRDIRAIPLTAHTAIQLDVGRPVRGFRPVDWSLTHL